MAKPPFHLLRDNATVQRYDRVANGTGGFSRVLGAVATDVRCRVQANLISDVGQDVDGATFEYNAVHTVFFAPTQDIQRDDVLFITNRNDRRLEVKGFGTDSDAATVYLKALCIEEQEGA